MRIGIDLGGTKIEGIALSDGGRELARLRVATPPDDYAATLRAVADLVAAIEEQTRASGTVGIGAPGAASPETGRIKNSNSLCLTGQLLRGDLAAILRRPVRLANDADCFALSEAVDGAAAGARSVFGVIIGTGTGGGIVIGGRLVSGPNAIAGEWGHNPLPWPRGEENPGPRCYCGKRGCIETFLSGPGLSRDHYTRTRQTFSASEIAVRAGSGEPEALATLERYTDRLARALGSVVNILDPEVIVLGGGVSNIEALYRRVPDIWGRYIFSDTVLTRLTPAKFGDSSGVRGAAWLWDDAAD